MKFINLKIRRINRNKKAAILFIGLFCIIMFNSVSALPDLVAEINYTLENASVGDTINVTMSVHNIGDADAYNVTVVKWGDDDCISTPMFPFNVPQNSTVNFTFNKTLMYGELELKLIVDSNNKITETNESNNNASAIFNFPVRIETDKDTYLPDESVNIKIIGDNGTGSVYIYAGCENYNILKYVNDSWNEIKQYLCGCSDWYAVASVECTNNTIQNTGFVCDESYTCAIQTVNSTESWNQKQWILNSIPCGNSSYNEWDSEHAGAGEYKAVFCYNSYCGGAMGYPCNNACIETANFTIQGYTITNLSDTENMSTELVDNPSVDPTNDEQIGVQTVRIKKDGNPVFEVPINFTDGNPDFSELTLTISNDTGKGMIVIHFGNETKAHKSGSKTIYVPVVSDSGWVCVASSVTNVTGMENELTGGCSNGDWVQPPQVNIGGSWYYKSDNMG